MAPTPRYDPDTITDVALEVFRARGYNATSMGDLATAAGVTKAAFYHHVSGKEELLSRGLTRALDALFAVFAEDRATNGRSIDRVRYVLRRVVELVHDCLPEVTVLLDARGNSDTERNALERRRQFDQRIAMLLQVAQHEGDVDETLDPQITARLMIGMANSLTGWYKPTGTMPIDAIADHVVQLCLNGCAPTNEHMNSQTD